MGAEVRVHGSPAIGDGVRREEPWPGDGLLDTPNARPLAGWWLRIVFAGLTIWVLLQALALALGVARGPAYALGHAFGALVFGLLLAAPRAGPQPARGGPAHHFAELLPLLLCLVCLAWPLTAMIALYGVLPVTGGRAPDWLIGELGWPLVLATAVALVSAWIVDGRGPSVRWPDLTLVLCAALTFAYALLSLPYWQLRLGTTIVVPAHLGVAVTAILLVLELLRRTTGSALPIFLLVLLAAALLGPEVPAELPLEGRSPAQLLTFAFFDEGILGSGIAATIAYAAPLALLAALMANTDVVGNLARLVAWAVRRGDLALGFTVGGFGLLAGHGRGLLEAVAPRREGSEAPPGQAEHLGAVLAVGAALSRVLPVILGVAAYGLASATGTALRRVVMELTIPALLTAAVLLLSLGAGGRRDSQPRQAPAKGRRLRTLLLGLLSLLPFAALGGAILAGQSGARATLAAAGLVLLLGMALHPRRSHVLLARSLATAGHLTAQIAATGLAAGVIVGMLVLSGVGERITILVILLAEIDIAMAIAFVLLFALILGAALPSLAAYLVAAGTFAPGLVQVGVSAPQAHIVLLFATCLAALAPLPLGLSEAAARIMGGRPSATAWAAFRLGAPALMVPLLLLGHPDLIVGDPEAIDGALVRRLAIDVAIAAVGLWSFLVLWHGRLAGRPVHGALRGAFIAPVPLSLVGTAVADALAAGFAVVLLYVWVAGRGPHDSHGQSPAA